MRASGREREDDARRKKSGGDPALCEEAGEAAARRACTHQPCCVMAEMMSSMMTAIQMAASGRTGARMLTSAARREALRRHGGARGASPMGIGPQRKPRKRSTGERFLPGSTFLPHLAWRSSATACVRPLVRSTSVMYAFCSSESLHEGWVGEEQRWQQDSPFSPPRSHLCYARKSAGARGGDSTHLCFSFSPISAGAAAAGLAVGDAGAGEASGMGATGAAPAPESSEDGSAAEDVYTAGSAIPERVCDARSGAGREKGVWRSRRRWPMVRL